MFRSSTTTYCEVGQSEGAAVGQPIMAKASPSFLLKPTSPSIPAITFVMYPTNENQSEALILTGVGSLFTAIAAALLEYSHFAAIFAFFSAFALAVALRNARERR